MSERKFIRVEQFAAENEIPYEECCKLMEEGNYISREILGTLYLAISADGVPLKSNEDKTIPAEISTIPETVEPNEKGSLLVHSSHVGRTDNPLEIKQKPQSADMAKNEPPKWLTYFSVAAVAVPIAIAAVFIETADRGTFEEKEICKAAIAKLMGRSPSIMTANTRGDIIHIQYKVGDGTFWQQKCKLQRNTVLWGAWNGRWRTHSSDSKLRFSVDGNYLTITERYSDGSTDSKTFRPGEL